MHCRKSTCSNYYTSMTSSLLKFAPSPQSAISVYPTCFLREKGGLAEICIRRAKNPSLKRPADRYRRSKNPAADGLCRKATGAGDEGRGALRSGAFCRSDPRVSQREAARRFGIDPRTVAKMLAYSVPPGYRRSRPPARPKLDRFTGIIDGILAGDEGRRESSGIPQSGSSTGFATSTAMPAGSNQIIG